MGIIGFFNGESKSTSSKAEKKKKALDEAFALSGAATADATGATSSNSIPRGDGEASDMYLVCLVKTLRGLVTISAQAELLETLRKSGVNTPEVVDGLLSLPIKSFQVPMSQPSVLVEGGRLSSSAKEVTGRLGELLEQHTRNYLKTLASANDNVESKREATGFYIVFLAETNIALVSLSYLVEQMKQLCNAGLDTPAGLSGMLDRPIKAFQVPMGQPAFKDGHLSSSIAEITGELGKLLAQYAKDYLKSLGPNGSSRQNSKLSSPTIVSQDNSALERRVEVIEATLWQQAANSSSDDTPKPATKPARKPGKKTRKPGNDDSSPSGGGDDDWFGR